MNKSDVINFLKNKGACSRGIAWVKASELNPATFKNAPIFYVIWLIEQIGGPNWTKYQDTCKNAYTEYDKAERKMWSEFLQVSGPHPIDHARPKTPHSVKYKKLESDIWSKYILAKHQAARDALTWEELVGIIDRELRHDEQI